MTNKVDPAPVETNPFPWRSDPSDEEFMSEIRKMSDRTLDELREDLDQAGESGDVKLIDAILTERKQNSEDK